MGDLNDSCFGYFRHDSTSTDVPDGKEVESVSDIDPDLIEAIEVLKSCYATEKFGEKGMNGVILIHRKKATD